MLFWEIKQLYHHHVSASLQDHFQQQITYRQAASEQGEDAWHHSYISSWMFHCAFRWHELILCLCLSLSPPQWLSQQLKFMHTSHQFLLLSSPPAKEARFRTAKKLYGSTFAFQWVRFVYSGDVQCFLVFFQGLLLHPVISNVSNHSGR